MPNLDIVEELIAYKKKIELYELSTKMDRDKIDNLLMTIDNLKKINNKLMNIINNIEDKNKVFYIMEEYKN